MSRTEKPLFTVGRMRIYQQDYEKQGVHITTYRIAVAGSLVLGFILGAWLL